MIKSVSHHHLLQYFIIELTTHIAQAGHNMKYPTITIHTIYHHLITTNAPTQFQIKSTKKYRPNISQLTTEYTPTGQHQQSNEDEQKEINNDINKDTNLSMYVLHDDYDEKHVIQNDLTIHAFCHHSSNRSRIIYEACGLSGHPAHKCFRRGFQFLPRDVQRRISAYKPKYGDIPDQDTSQRDTQKHVLPPPETKLSDPTPTPHPPAIIHKLQHVLSNDDDENTPPHYEDIEFINTIQMGEGTPTINIVNRDITCNDQKPTTLKPTVINPLTIDVLTTDEQVHLHELHALQYQLMHPTPSTYFKTHHREYFPVDTGANVHTMSYFRCSWNVMIIKND